MFAVQTHPAILDIVESLIGPEILAHPQFNIRPKLPNQDTSVVPWHQDLGYLQPDASETFMVNFWIPLVDATVENGCMEVIAGSHKVPLINHVTGLGPGRNFKGIVDEALPDGEQVQCPVPLGSVLLIQHKTIHRSVPNHSDHIRWRHGYTLQRPTAAYRARMECRDLLREARHSLHLWQIALRIG